MRSSSLNQFRDQPVGNLRITVPRIALPIVIEPIVAQFRRDYPGHCGRDKC